jgi:hypothetical protein
VDVPDAWGLIIQLAEACVCRRAGSTKFHFVVGAITNLMPIQAPGFAQTWSRTSRPELKTVNLR